MRFRVPGLAPVVCCYVAACAQGGTAGKPKPGADDAGGTDASVPPPAWLEELPAVDVECGDADSTRLFQERIQPLFEDDRPSSCNECHLSGLDLEVFLRGSPCETFACMKAYGFVDEADPDESLLLAWIARADPESPLITPEILAEEYQGVREWLHYSASCDECGTTSCAGDAGTDFCVNEKEPVVGYDPTAFDPGGCSDAALLEVFRYTVYASRGRCSPCHYTDHEFERFLAPQWLDVLGECEGASRNTYWNVLDRGYVDVEEPENSLLLLKPLAKSLGGVEHGGHDKFWSLTEDQGYLNFRYFIDRYTGCQ